MLSIGAAALRRSRSDRRDCGSEKGFTLLEILVVVVIIGVLATLVGPTVFRRIGDARQVTGRNQIEMFATALEHYRLDVGRYPTTEQGLAALWERPGLPPTPAAWNGPYLLKAPPRDPWGNEYGYRSPGDRNPSTYDLYTWGADGQPGGEGEAADIVNW